MCVWRSAGAVVLGVGLSLALVGQAFAASSSPSTGGASAGGASVAKPVLPMAAKPHLLVDLTVTDGHGKPVTGLTPFDFHLTDNGVAQRVLAMQTGALTGAGTPLRVPVEMVIVLDAVNCNFKKMQLERQDVAEFLRRRGGKLPVPTRIVMLNDTKMIVSPQASEDGDGLAKFIEQTPNPVQTLRFQAGYYGEMDRATWSMNEMDRLARLEAARPGRKLVVWISHGWHPLSRDYLAMDTADLKRDYQLDEALTDDLLQARMTLMSIDPILALPGENLNYYKAFVKPVTKWEQVDTPNLMLQVLAMHTGGRVLEQSTDIQGEIEQAMQTLAGWYTLVYSPPVTTVAGEFRPIAVTVAGDGAADAKVHAPVGYYANPQ